MSSENLAIVHLCKYFPPDMRPCMQGTHNRQQQRRTFGAMPARIRDNRRTLVKKPANRENIYKDRLYHSAPHSKHAICAKKLADNHCSSITKGSIDHIKHMLIHYNLLPREWIDLRSIMFDICIYIAFLLCMYGKIV